ncbi:hypothetical protein CCHR01_11897 [Colletotrichum chrysophilum]|uniref:Uncharacterized protein n=1 Tax=Colletotrichum chrysophilum TaxID=1836956 RepID=A0AAD9AH32_9PEZI|nr:hypothetical protein CCHR01_11897 [Colletotrichum chrysophilum]
METLSAPGDPFHQATTIAFHSTEYSSDTPSQLLFNYPATAQQLSNALQQDRSNTNRLQLRQASVDVALDATGQRPPAVPPDLSVTARRLPNTPAETRVS